MGNFEDITGQRFGKLVVAKRIENKDNRPYFLCICDCGKTKEVSSQNLKKGNVQSCGCFRRDSKFKDLTGQIFNRLTVLRENGTLGEGKAKKSAFLCKCECGEEKTIRGGDLVSGKVVSCGCWRNEKAIENIFGVDTTVEDPRISSATKVYKSNYNNGNLTFEQFMILTQKKCFYCNIDPLNNANRFLGNKLVAISSLENGNFNYNGLDRINSDLLHDFENLVTACGVCNKSKSDMTIDEFKKFIIRVYNYSVNSDVKLVSNDFNKYLNLLKEENIDKTEYNRKYHPSISSAKVMFKNYNDGDITFEQFLEMTQANCNYCGIEPSNKFNSHNIRSDSSDYAKQNGDFIYNGLDRINSSLPHNVSNLLPSCRSCNWSKGDRTLEEYKDWIVRVYNHLIK